jgi:hypothetical protein
VASLDKCLVGGLMKNALGWNKKVGSGKVLTLHVSVGFYRETEPQMLDGIIFLKVEILRYFRTAVIAKVVQV